MAAQPYTVVFGSLTVGVGTDFGIIRVAGLNAGQYKTTEVVNPGGAGSWFTSLYTSSKHPMIQLDYHGDQVFDDVMETLEGYLAPLVSEDYLYYNFPNVLGGADRKRKLLCRPDGVFYDITPLASTGYMGPDENFAIAFTSERGLIEDDT